MRYKLRHKETGLFYGPQYKRRVGQSARSSVKTNLSENGVTYPFKPTATGRAAWYRSHIGVSGEPPTGTKHKAVVRLMHDEDWEAVPFREGQIKHRIVQNEGRYEFIHTLSDGQAIELVVDLSPLPPVVVRTLGFTLPFTKEMFLWKEKCLVYMQREFTKLHPEMSAFKAMSVLFSFFKEMGEMTGGDE